jgi:hypothetical protein
MVMCPSENYDALVRRVEKDGCASALKRLLEEKIRPSHPEESTVMEAICRHQKPAIRRYLLENVAAAIHPVGHGFWKHGLLDSAYGGLETWCFVTAMGGQLPSHRVGMELLQAVCLKSPVSGEGAALVKHVLTVLPATQLTAAHLASAWRYATYSANHHVLPVLEGHPAWVMNASERETQAARLVQQWHECVARHALRPSLSNYQEGLAYCLVHLDPWVRWESVLGNAASSDGQALLKRLLLSHRLAQKAAAMPEVVPVARPARF